MTVFPARFPDHCDECGGHVNAGDLITFDRLDGHRHLRHASCPDDPAVSLRPGETICPNCFTVRPCECDDEETVHA